MTHHPLSRDDIERCLQQVSRPSRRAALLVALPRTELPVCSGPDGSWAWRGACVPFGTDPIASLAELVARQSRPGDSFIDPGAPVWAWARPLRSGCDVVVFGMPELVGRPALRVDAAVDDPALWTVVRACADGEIDAPPAVLDTPSGAVLLSEHQGCWKVAYEQGARRFLPHPGRTMVDRSRTALADPSLVSLSVLEGPPGQWVMSGTPDGASGLRVDVPVRCDGSGTTVGVSPALVDRAPTCPVALPAGWAYAGRHAGDVVAVTPGGTWAYVRPESPVCP